MKRTPQPNLAQSRLTSSGGTLHIHGAPQPPARQEARDSPNRMDTEPAPATLPMSAGNGAGLGTPEEPLTADFFRNLIGENTKMVTEKIETLSEDLLTLSKTVDSNKEGIARNNAEMVKHAKLIQEQRTTLELLADRVAKLEGGGARRRVGKARPT